MSNGGESLVERILASAEWRRGSPWRSMRQGLAHRSLHVHVEKQVIPFIDHWYRPLADYWNLVALAYLHDIGQPLVRSPEGRRQGDLHSLVSARVAVSLGAPSRLVSVILRHNRCFAYWRRLFAGDGQWHGDRWSSALQARFLRHFGFGAVDLTLLGLFQRATNAYSRPPVSRESTDAVYWFERRLLVEGLLSELPVAAQDARSPWSNNA